MAGKPSSGGKGSSSGKSSGHVSRSSITGKFVSDRYAQTHPKTTETQKKK